MIACITGTVFSATQTSSIIDVHGVGYLVRITAGTTLPLGTTVTLHTYLAVRENALDLYGFVTEHELSLFKELIELPKIGPKTALQILSQASLQTIMHAVETNDPVYLTKMSGIGKKSAEKIVQGLAERIDSLSFGYAGGKTSQGSSDVMDALIALGYTQKDALAAVQNIPPDITDTHARIKYALKYIQD